MNAIDQRVRRESAKHNRMRRANAGAGQHGNRQLRRHAHVDGDAVSFADAKIPENIGELLHLLPELLVGIGANFAGLTLPNQRRFVLARRPDVAIKTVVGEIHLSADEPLGPGRFPLQDLVPFPEPVQFLGGAGPEFFRLLYRFFVESFIFGQALNLSLLRKLRRGLETALLV